MHFRNSPVLLLLPALKSQLSSSANFRASCIKLILKDVAYFKEIEQGKCTLRPPAKAANDLWPFAGASKFNLTHSYMINLTGLSHVSFGSRATCP